MRVENVIRYDWKPAFDMAGWYEDQNKYKYNKSIKLYKWIIISVW